MKSDHLSWLLTYFQYHKLEQAWIIFFHDPLLDGEQENEVKGGTSSRFFFLFFFFFFLRKQVPATYCSSVARNMDTNHDYFITKRKG